MTPCHATKAYRKNRDEATLPHHYQATSHQNISWVQTSKKAYTASFLTLIGHNHKRSVRNQRAGLRTGHLSHGDTNAYEAST